MVLFLPYFDMNYLTCILDKLFHLVKEKAPS